MLMPWVLCLSYSRCCMTLTSNSSSFLCVELVPLHITASHSQCGTYLELLLIAKGMQRIEVQQALVSSV